jgi:hypothetical protein
MWGFKVQGDRVQCLESKVHCQGFGALSVTVYGFGFRVWVVGCRI